MFEYIVLIAIFFIGFYFTGILADKFNKKLNPPSLELTEESMKLVDWEFNKYNIVIHEIPMGDNITHIAYDKNGYFVLQHKDIFTLIAELTDKFEHELVTLTSNLFENTYIINKGVLFDVKDDVLTPVIIDRP